MQDSEILFIVTSSIGSKHGHFTEKQRYDQTSNTIESIRRKYPESKIIIIDNTGHYIFQNANLESIDVSNKMINEKIQIFDDKFLRSGKFGMAKTEGEINLMLEALEYITDDIKYVFKLSGRYQLGPKFKKNNFDYSKMIFKSKEKTWIDIDKRVNHIDYQYSSRFWGFPILKLNYIKTAFEQMLSITDSISEKNNDLYVDIEHLFYYFFADEPKEEIPEMHVYGFLAPTGELVYD